MGTSDSVSTQRLESQDQESKWLVDDAAITFLLSIDLQTGLFDRMATLEPPTSAEIASAADLDERYVVIDAHS